MRATLIDAFAKLWTLDQEVFAIAWLSLRVSISAVVLGSFFGIPAGALIAIAAFPGRSGFIAVLNAFMGLPAVVVGLVVYLLLSRSGPLGTWGLLFTPTAMIVAQTILVTPLIAALTRQMIEDADRELGEQLRSMRLTLGQRARTLIIDVRFSLVVAVLAAFGTGRFGGWRSPCGRGKHRRPHAYHDDGDLVGNTEGRPSSGPVARPRPDRPHCCC